MAQPPSFPFYPADWVLGTLTFTLAEDGAYLRLVMHQWSSGSVPGDDLSAVAKILRVTEWEARPLWATVSKKFVRGDDGQWRNTRLETQRAEKERYHAAKRANGLKGGRPPNREQTETKPTGSVSVNRDESLSLALVPDPTGQRDARAPEPSRAKRPDPYAHAMVQAPNGRAFWEGPIFSIPNEWARKTLAAANGKAAGSTIVLFAKALTERLQREGGEAPTKGFLGWLDNEWTAYRQPSTPSPYAPAEAVIAEMRAVSASIAAEAGTPESRRAIVREVLGRRPS